MIIWAWVITRACVAACARPSTRARGARQRHSSNKLGQLRNGARFFLCIDDAIVSAVVAKMASDIAYRKFTKSIATAVYRHGGHVNVSHVAVRASQAWWQIVEPYPTAADL